MNKPALVHNIHKKAVAARHAFNHTPLALRINNHTSARTNRHADLDKRLTIVLDTHATTAPEFVAEARSLHGYLTTLDWVTEVHRLAHNTDLPAVVRNDIKHVLA